ncbi:MAG: aspartate carbamoyltransferase, partial [candidate division WOR-3 bacterium]
GINLKNLKYAKEDVIIMHPGPINRGVEIDSEVADSNYSLILEQVENGLGIRMSILYYMLA